MTINSLEIANKKFLFADVQLDANNDCTAFCADQIFNKIEWQPIGGVETCKNMQLLHGFD